MKQIRLEQNAFQGNAPVMAVFPDDWDVSTYPLPCDAWPALSAEKIRQRIRQPIGMLPLSELAKGKEKVCIVFDDITRGTPTQQMAEAVLEELLAAGVAKQSIRFLCALGTHGAHSLKDHIDKLGERIVHEYPIYNHNCYENCISVGTTRRGFDVRINAEFMKCDLRIGLGAVAPHTMNGFGGGSKMIIPGIAHIDTIAHNHETATAFLNRNHLNSSEMTGDLAISGMREEIEEMARMAGPFFKVDCIYNSRLELVDLYAGDPVEEYYAAIPAAKRAYAIERFAPADVVLVNVNAKATEATIATGLGAMCLKPGGDVVVVDMTCRGQATHYLFGAFGRETGGRMMGGMPSVRPKVDRYICWMPHPDLGAAHWFGEIDKQIYVDTWEEVLRLLKEKHKTSIRVAVVTEATLAYFRQENGDADVSSDRQREKDTNN